MASRRFDPELLLIGKLVRLLEGRSRDSALRIARYLADRFSCWEVGYANIPAMPAEEQPAAEPSPLPLFPADVAGTVSDSSDHFSGPTVTFPPNAPPARTKIVTGYDPTTKSVGLTTTDVPF